MYVDLLKDLYDVDLFDYYCSSEFVAVDVFIGAMKIWGDGKVRIYMCCDLLFDGKYVIVEVIYWFYLYLVLCGRFLKKVWVADSDGKVVREVADLFLVENVFIVYNVMCKGFCVVNWCLDKSVLLYWIEV